MRESCTSVLGARAVCAALALLLAVLPAGAARADLSGYTIEKLVLEGDPDPVSGTIIQIFGMDLDEAGRVAAWTFVSDGPASAAKLFTIEGGVPSAAVTEGDVAPDTGGETFTDVARPRLAAPDVLAYYGIYTPASSGGGFLRVGGTDLAMALAGTPAPGGGTIDGVGNIHVARSTPAVSLSAQVDTGGGLVPAHLVHEAAGLREVYREGDAAPAPAGGTFSPVQASSVLALAADGTTHFGAPVSGGTVASGLFRASPLGVVTPLLLENDAVTTPGGGTFVQFARSVGGNAAGDVVVGADVLRSASVRAGIFAVEGGVQREIIFRGDAIPGTSPQRYFLGQAGSGPPALSGTGGVAFVASLTDASEFIVESAVLVDLGDGIEVLAREGDAVPGVGGATFTDFLQVRIDDAGQLAFQASTTAGSGVFLASPPAEIEALPPLGLALLAMMLTALAAWYGHRGRGRA